MKTIFVFLSAALLLSSCNKTQSSTIHPDSFVFGYCRCCLCMTPARCFRYYEIKGNQIFPDSMSNFPGPEVFALSSLSNNKYQLASALISNFPQYLQNSPNQTYGNIDCNTHAALHIEYTENGQRKTWDIDQDTTKQPLAIRAYIVQLNSVLQQLNQ